MKSIKLALLLVLCGSAASARSVCDDPLSAPVVCVSMGNLRSHIMMLEGQRDLMQVNYGLMQTTAQSLSAVALDVKSKLSVDQQNHSASLTAIVAQADQIAKQAQSQNSDVFVLANKLRSNCVACHDSTNTGNSANKAWDDIFRTDWASITAACNAPGKNPYLCKQMHGMITAYGYIMTAEAAKIENFEMTEQAASEIQRISADLITRRFSHDKGANLHVVNALAKEVVQAAQARDPQTFEKAYAMTDGCVTCHKSTISFSGVSLRPVVNLWK